MKRQKRKLKIQDVDTRTVRNVFAVFVEQMQNIIRYSAERELPDSDLPPELRYGVLTIGHFDGDYVVYAGNMVSRSDIGPMRECLNEISTMGKSQIKIAYKRQLKAEPDINSKGAGLGLIEIARRASKPIEFDFLELDVEYAFFVSKVRI